MMIRMQMMTVEMRVIMKVMCACYDDDDDGAQKHGLEKSTLTFMFIMHAWNENDLHIGTGRKDLQVRRKK